MSAPEKRAEEPIATDAEVAAASGGRAAYPGRASYEAARARQHLLPVDRLRKMRQEILSQPITKDAEFPGENIFKGYTPHHGDGSAGSE